MTFIDWDGKKYLVKVKSYNIFKTISAADTKYHYLCSLQIYLDTGNFYLPGPRHLIFDGNSNKLCCKGVMFQTPNLIIQNREGRGTWKAICRISSNLKTAFPACFAALFASIRQRRREVAR